MIINIKGQKEYAKLCKKISNAFTNIVVFLYLSSPILTLICSACCTYPFV